jgi:hypothetical protein
MVGKALKFPTGMSLIVGGVPAQLYPQLPPQSGISNVTDYIDLIADVFLLVLTANQACLHLGWASLTQRFGFLSLNFSHSYIIFYYNKLMVF